MVGALSALLQSFTHSSTVRYLPIYLVLHSLLFFKCFTAHLLIKAALASLKFIFKGSFGFIDFVGFSCLILQ